ncbi:MAG: cytochrome d ubiquinol oxidase subunit II [Candidatus Brocadiia bacterium]
MLGIIWFLLWGVLWAVYFLLDGFDLGAAMLMPFVAKNDEQRRRIVNSMGPFWDGNEVWLITAGGVTFAAFPKVYAVMFSTLYTPLMLLLFALIIRGVSFEFRSKVESLRWRKIWDTALVVGSFLPALLLGVAFANIFKGIPFDGDYIFQGNLFTLLNPYGLMGGLLFVLMFLYHGALWIAIKNDGELAQRAVRYGKAIWNALLVIAAAFLIVTYFDTALWNNFLANPVLLVIPLAAVCGLIGTRLFLGTGNPWRAWFASSAMIFSVTMFGVIGLFPMLFPSSINPSYSLGIANAASSDHSLLIMLCVAIVFVPIVIGYQVWVYRTFRHKITADDFKPGQSY